MPNWIKGITVEIGGDTTGLDKALKSVNSSISHTQSAMRDVYKLLKLGPSNTELLAQKRKLLQDAATSTKEKLGNSITGAGKMLMPFSTAVGGPGIAAVKTAADFDSAMSKAAAVSGATGDDLQSFRNKAREMGEKTKFSAERTHTVRSTQISCDFNRGGPQNDGLPKNSHAEEQRLQPERNGENQSSIPRKGEGGIRGSGPAGIELAIGR